MPRSFSLRARVAIATALGTTIVVGILGVIVALAISHNNLAQLDRRLDLAADVLAANAAAAELFLPVFGDGGAFAMTIRAEPDGALRASTPTELPVLEPGAQTVTVDGIEYRAYTTPIESNRGLMSVAVLLAEAQDVTTDQHRQVLIAGVVAVAAATGLGWLLGGGAVSPLVDLTRRIVARDRDLSPRPSGVREADELASAVGTMLDDVARARADTDAALATARDFAAAAAHEMRTPLTAMRTDVEVLSTHDLGADDRSEILADLARTQARLEATLNDLERLARGDLSTDRDFVDVDLVEICDTAAADAMRRYPGLDVDVRGNAGQVLRGLPAGLRLLVDNAITNAVRHGGASLVRITVATNDESTSLIVDDDGAGIPAAERSAVFERFRRGSNARQTGSGLGLTLVAQQAALHGGDAYLDESPLGGARLVIRLPRTRRREP
ncbi:sensor histidine kinase [Rhodococcus coprophilus]|uniref:histidine kinase n=1 Tax=Rhodococcus coprophilus TaxID=38310 RepID=A0A2X4UDA8_9NOCA|nr:HAMP domain-containing sensor histidine kinase [Rhodococcus coprophilus]MBM7458012.1 two-component system sensor histidine kinase PrrB [Rhodococcus coprophilus]SQI30880.1 sensor kinase, two-component system [Rhodococcus coprophilus]